MNGVYRWLRSSVGKVGRLTLPGVRQVHAQVAVYAKAWEEANALALSGQGPLWVVLGDSTAQGIGAPSYDQGYVGQLRRMLDEHSSRPWRVLNFSRSGARAADVVNVQLPRLEELDTTPDLVTCAIGANDMVPTPLPQVLDSIREIIRRLPRGSIIATIPQGLRSSRATVVNEMIRDEAPAAGLVVADVWAHTGPPWHGKLAEDGFHPGLAGYAEWAKAFAEALTQVPPRRDSG
ncbi:MAG TPA: GDSL-type esterase/lipase family protein [Acidimicrobiales bacterium]|nr:GDSL-type esterase/lipase family protein [Acidimicrobiales bacterium]